MSSTGPNRRYEASQAVVIGWLECFNDDGSDGAAATRVFARAARLAASSMLPLQLPTARQHVVLYRTMVPGGVCKRALGSRASPRQIPFFRTSPTPERVRGRGRGRDIEIRRDGGLLLRPEHLTCLGPFGPEGRWGRNKNSVTEYPEPPGLQLLKEMAQHAGLQNVDRWLQNLT